MTNDQRARRAILTLREYLDEQNGDAWIASADFLADLMHFTDSRGWDFWRLYEIAVDYHRAELEEEGGASKHDWKPPKVRFKKKRRS